jgi:hypothetical protein
MLGQYISSICILKCYCNEFFDPFFIGLFLSTYSPNMFTADRIEIALSKRIL